MVIKLENFFFHFLGLAEIRLVLAMLLHSAKTMV